MSDGGLPFDDPFEGIDRDDSSDVRVDPESVPWRRGDIESDTANQRINRDEAEGNGESERDEWNPEHELCAGADAFFCAGMRVEVGRVFRDTEADRLVAVRDVEEPEQVAVLVEVEHDTEGRYKTHNGRFAVASGDTEVVEWYEEGGRYVPR